MALFLITTKDITEEITNFPENFWSLIWDVIGVFWSQRSLYHCHGKKRSEWNGPVVPSGTVVPNFTNNSLLNTSLLRPKVFCPKLWDIWSFSLLSAVPFNTTHPLSKYCNFFQSSKKCSLKNTQMKQRFSWYVSGKLPTYPSPKSTLTLTSHLGQNVGLGEGWVGSFPETNNDPDFPLGHCGWNR